MDPFDISVAQLAAMRAEGRAHLLLDVREPQELAIAAIDGAAHVPMSAITDALGGPPFNALDAETPICVLCHHGVRSAAVTRFLRANGFPSAINVAGGIDAWSVEVDADVPRY